MSQFNITSQKQEPIILSFSFQGHAKESIVGGVVFWKLDRIIRLHSGFVQYVMSSKGLVCREIMGGTQVRPTTSGLEVRLDEF